jgi:hypothetical protein
MQSVFQRLHGRANSLSVTAGIGLLQGFGSFHHAFVEGAGRACGFLALSGFAVESFVNGLAEGIPQLLFLATLQRHTVRLGLPALLQGFDGIEPQHRRYTQDLGLFNERLS